jgi:hypothetical protein
MRTSRALPWLLAAALLGACASRLTGDVEYEQGVDFARFKTFEFAPVPDAQRDNPNWKVAREEIEKALVAKGLQQASGGDLLVEYSLGTRAKVRVSGASSGGKHGGLVIELEDRRTGNTLWHGWAAETWYDSMDPAAEIRKAVPLILAQYPPK